MTNPVQEFYERAYPTNRSRQHFRSFLSTLYMTLKRYEDHREEVTYRLISPGRKRFLDIGCGNGDLVFKSLGKTNSSYGIDIARTRLKIAEKNKSKLNVQDKKRVTFTVGNADEKLPFKNNFFDSIAMIATLEHFFDPYHVIEEVTRILEKRGELIVQVPNIAFLPHRIAIALGKLPVTSEHEEGWDGGHLHYFTVPTTVELLRKYGYTIDTVTCSGIFAPLRSWWVSLLGPDIIIKAIKR